MRKASTGLKLPRKGGPMTPPSCVSPATLLQPATFHCHLLTAERAPSGGAGTEQLAVWRVNSGFPRKSPEVMDMGEKGGAGWRKKGGWRQESYQKGSERKTRELPTVTER